MLLKSRKFVGQLVSEENILTFVTSPLRITSRKIRNSTTVFRLYCVINRILIFNNDDFVNEVSGWWGRMTEDLIHFCNKTLFFWRATTYYQYTKNYEWSYLIISVSIFFFFIFFNFDFLINSKPKPRPFLPMALKICFSEYNILLKFNSNR